MSKKSLRIATWNIASNKDYNAIAAKVAQLDVDICAVQEVSLDPAVDLPVMFGHGPGNASGYHWYFTPALAPEELGGGKYEYYGLGMVTRIPLCRMAAFQLGPGHTGSVVDAENEPRILQVAALPLEEPVFVGNTHLAATADWSASAVRRSQAGKIASVLRPLATQGPLILCGDFNAEPSSSDLAEIREALPYFYSSHERTYVEDHGRPPIDFFCSSVALEVNISVCPADGLSDHSIVIATLHGIGSRA
ncbi:endonuclease/exonuclease/phosphatase family protein [Bradyrhizobium sp.]|uniref:endonuclease/exonuclease/phosphatase family protein n=1 Tax=Bradyrhizobium sp. TaxID=376 RepID=UPI003C7862BE